MIGKMGDSKQLVDDAFCKQRLYSLCIIPTQ